MAKPFTVKSLEAIKKDAKTADGGCKGLYFWTRGNSRVWTFRSMRDGKALELSIGPYPEISLADARTKANAMREAIRTGKDPRKPVANGVITFKIDAMSYYEHKRNTWVLDHQTGWLKTFERHVFPIIGDRPTHDLKVADLVGVLEPIWTTHYRTAFNIHLWCKAIIARAIRLDDEDHPRFNRPNPSDRVLDALPRGVEPQTVQHPSLPWDQAPAFYKRLVAMDCRAATAIRFLMLTCGPRANEIIGAKWDEIDGNVFHVPSDRMKSGIARDIPLSDAAVALLKSIPRTSEYVFPGRKGKHVKGVFVPFSGRMHSDSMQILIREEMKLPWHVHGLRSTFRTWVSDHAQSIKDHDAAEIQLDHVVGSKVHRAYDRIDMMPERRALAERWAAFLQSA
jgi:integrase